jgi:hypothetical protein
LWQKKIPRENFCLFCLYHGKQQKMNFVKLKNEIISCCISLNTKPGSAAEREVLAIIAPVTGIGRFSNKNKKYLVLK